MTVFTGVTKDDAALLLKSGFTLAAPKTQYEDLRLIKRGVTLILYTSGTLLVQGKDPDAVLELLQKKGIGQEKKKQTFREGKGTIIGSDESLKGDTFGGMIVAAVKADDETRKKLLALGVADSKTLEDKEVVSLAEEIRRIAPCHVLTILPQEYNNHQSGITQLLNDLHKDCAAPLLPGTHVVDKYPGCKIGDIIIERAESKYVEVAAASILARTAALQQLQALSKKAGFTIPKGSTHVKAALQELVLRKLPLEKFVKINFRNVKEFVKE